MKKVLNDSIANLKYEYHLFGYEDSYNPNETVWNETLQYWISAHVTAQWYHQVNLAKTDGKFITKRLHNLLCREFIGWGDESNCVTRHINHDKLDNRLSNLTFGTQAENSMDNYFGNAKYAKDRYTYIKLDKNTLNVVDEYHTEEELHNAGYTKALVQSVVSGKHKTHGKFKWQIVDHLLTQSNQPINQPT